MVCAAATGMLGKGASSVELQKAYAQCSVIWDSAPYVNWDALDVLSEPLLIHEGCNYVFAILTLLHAWQHGGLRLWIGFVIFGYMMELVGICVGSHHHAQYLIQVSYFCPLKEMVWYGFTMYTSFFVTQNLQLSIAAHSMMVGLLQQLVNMPYECCVRRLQLLSYNVDFTFANVRNDWLQAPVVNILANLIMPTFVGMLGVLSIRYNLGAVSTVLLLGVASVPLSGPFFAPMTMMKMAGCLNGPFPQGVDFQPWFQWYQTCMMTSPVPENVILASFITVYTCFVVMELLSKNKSERVNRSLSTLRLGPSLGWIALLPVAQIIKYIYLLCKYSRDSSDFFAALFTFCNILLISIVVHIFVENTIASSRQINSKRKRL